MGAFFLMTGRPTKYTPALVASAREYLDGGYLDKRENENEEEVIPSVAGLAGWLGVSRQTIYEWSKDPDKSIFSDILEGILSKQERILISSGLRGTFNASIAKLALGKHGYSDKTDNTLSAPDGGPVQWVVTGVNANADTTP